MIRLNTLPSALLATFAACNNGTGTGTGTLTVTAYDTAARTISGNYDIVVFQGAQQKTIQGTLAGVSLTQAD